MDFLPRSPVVVARIPADVCHENSNAFAFPNQIFSKFGAEFGAVDVSINSPDWPEGFEVIEN